MRNTLDEINSRFDEADVIISDLEDKVAKKTPIQKNKKGKKVFCFFKRIV